MLIKVLLWIVISFFSMDFPSFSDVMEELALNVSFSTLLFEIFEYAILTYPGIYQTSQLSAAVTSFFNYVVILQARIQNQTLQRDIYVYTEELELLEETEEFLNQSLVALQWLSSQTFAVNSSFVSTETAYSVITEYNQLLPTSGRN